MKHLVRRYFYGMITMELSKTTRHDGEISLFPSIPTPEESIITLRTATSAISAVKTATVTAIGTTTG